MVSLKDIAAELNLSVSVVSRALNPAPDANARVSEKTRMLVLETCQRMGYRRNRIAEFVKRRRFPAIGVFIPRTANSLIAKLLFGISEEAGSKDFPLLIHTGMDENSYWEFMHNNLDLAASGIITYSATQYHKSSNLDLLKKYSSNGGKVLILNDCTVKDYTKLYMDEYEGGRLAADMLMASGCQNFICFNNEEFSFAASVTQMRYEGFCGWLHNKGASCLLCKKIEEIPALLKNNSKCGVFAVSDSLAMNIINLASASGLRAPEDFKLVGYDDMEWSEIMGLSTIHQPFREEGRQAAVKIIEMIYGKNVEDEIFTPRAILRKTTAF